MVLEKTVCETCGGQLEILDSKTAKCTICGNTYLVKDAPVKKTKPADNRPQSDPQTICNQQFFYFCADNKLAEAKKTWNENKDIIDLGFVMLANTALTQSAYKQHIDVVKWLIEIGAPLDATNEARQTALIRATIKGDKEIAKVLLDAGANTDVVDKEGCNALSYALNSIYEKHWEIAPLLIEYNANLDIIDRYGKTALIHAIKRKNKEIVKALLDAGANINAKDRGGRPAIIHAITESKEMAFLLIDNGVDINVSDKDGETALEFAARYRIFDEIKQRIAQCKN
ncbi:MAG: ankyrin repeat domain-containing protein [Treponema sp.]|jgi:ankyrin repeat protein|nr:ankyrin repeat domain-containing protein [Treponema sp.]